MQLWQAAHAAQDIMDKRETAPSAPLKNCGNTCYLNAFLQCLAGVISGRRWAQLEEAHTCCTVAPCVMCAVFRVLGAMRRCSSLGGGAFVVPQPLLDLRSSIMGREAVGTQEDPAEFAELLLAHEDVQVRCVESVRLHVTTRRGHS